MTADALLSRLHKVKRTGPSTWIALCPAHDDKSPSLSIREVDDRTLVKCWAGCGADEIVDALSLTLADLFPPRPKAPGAGYQPRRRSWVAADLIDLAAHEAAVAAVVAIDLLHERPDADHERLLTAASRLADIREAVHGR